MPSKHYLTSDFAQDKLTCKRFVFLTDEKHMPKNSKLNALCYETLMAHHSPDFKWPRFSERVLFASRGGSHTLPLVQTKTRRRPYATRRARPATPRACCTRTAAR